jgi:PAS domain S-box-containing protein
MSKLRQKTAKTEEIENGVEYPKPKRTRLPKFPITPEENATLLQANRNIETIWLLKMLAYSIILFSYIGAMSLKNWSLAFPLALIYTAITALLLGIFYFTSVSEPPAPLQWSILGLNATLTFTSTVLLGLDYSMFFTLLPLFVSIGQAQLWFPSYYALPMSGLVAVGAFVCLVFSPVPGIHNQFFVLLSLMLLPLISITVVLRFMIRENRQRLYLAETLAELQNSEMRYRMVTERANDAIFIISPLNIIFANPKTEQVTGYTLEELKLMRFVDLLTEDSKASVMEAIRKAEKEKGRLQTTQLKLVRRDGVLRDIELSGATLDDPKMRRIHGLVIIARDNTERLSMREQVERRNRDLTVLNTVVSAGQSLEIEKILNDVVNTLVETLGADLAGVTLVEEETKLLKVAAYRSGNPEDGYTILNAVTTEDGTVREDNFTSQVAVTGKPILISDMLTDGRVTNPIIAQMKLRSFVAAPIKNRDRTLGVLNLISRKANAFGQEEMNLLSSIGSSLGVAVENARLYSTSQNQVRELRCLAEIARTINIEQSVGQTLTSIAEVISQTLDYKGCAIFLLDNNYQFITAHGGYGLPPQYMVNLNEWIDNLRKLPAPKALEVLQNLPIFDSIQTKQPTVTTLDKAKFSVLKDFDKFSREQGWKVIVDVPLLEADRACGVMVYYSGNSSLPSANELGLLQTIANQTMVAVRNAQLYREQERRADQLRAVSEIGQKITNILNLNELLPYVTRLLYQTFDYYNVAVFLLDPEQPENLMLKSAHGWDKALLPTDIRINLNNPNGVITWVARTGQPLNVPDVREEPLYREYGPDGMVRSELCVPVRFNNQVVGVLDVASTILGGFDAIDLTTMQALADQVGIALENARLYTQVNKSVNQLIAANTELEKATRHKSEFLANMSHELRTPLNAIIGFSEILQDKIFGDLNQKQDRYVGNILTSGRHLLSLVNDVLDLAKVEAGRMELIPEDFNPGEAIMDVKHIVTGIANKKKLTINVEIETPKTQIKADKSKFKQILYNLLSNAVKFTPEGGTITVFCRVMFDCMLEVAVQDTGIGISPENHDRIFEEFSQVDSSYSRQYQGTGLGLALCRRLVELHGGSIKVDSEVGIGSTFTFNIPTVCSAETTKPAPPSEAIDRILQKQVRDTLEKQVENMATNHLSEVGTTYMATIEPSGINGKVDEPLVVIVEDDDKSAELLNLYLCGNGFATMRLSRGSEVIPRIRTLEPKPSLVTLDVLLEKENGWDVLRELKADPQLATIPVLVVSILDGTKIGRELGAADAITKPISKELLLQKVSEIVPKVPSPVPSLMEEG